MSSVTLIPVLSPEGVKGTIPQDQIPAAKERGFKVLMRVLSPEGQLGTIPAEQWQDASARGFKVVQMKEPEQPKEGFGKAIGSDLAGIAKATATMSGLSVAKQAVDTYKENFDSIVKTGKTVTQADHDARIAAGRSEPYAFGAAVNEALGVNVKGEEAAADKGDVGGVLGHAAAVPVAAIATAGISKGIAKVAPEVSKFAAAESNPNKLYNAYLGPVADTPHPVPNAPAPVMKAVLRDMEAAGDGEIAARIKSGDATIGDLDQARQRANRLARSIYRSPGNYSPGMAEGADKFATAIRDSIYPEIEKAHGMEAGSLRGVKNLQGALMEAERNHGLVNKLVTQGLGAGAGAYLGNETGIPGGAYVGGAIGAKIAEPVASGINRGIIGLRTKGIAMNLPQPASPPAAVVAPQPPIAGLLPAPATRLGPIPDVSGTPINPEVIPPAPNYTTRAQRLGLLLPERTGGTPLMEIKGEEAMKLLRAKSVVVRDPRTGRMVRMYVTSGEAQ